MKNRMNLKELQKKFNLRLKRQKRTQTKAKFQWGNIHIAKSPDGIADCGKIDHTGIASKYKKRSPMHGEIK